MEDEEEEEKLCLSDEDDAFVVEDGYLSEDEGIGGEMDIDETCSNSSAGAGETNMSPESGPGVDSSPLETLVRGSNRSGQTMLFTTLNVTMPSKKYWTRGDPSMLEFLKVTTLNTDKISLRNK